MFIQVDRKVSFGRFDCSPGATHRREKKLYICDTPFVKMKRKAPPTLLDPVFTHARKHNNTILSFSRGPYNSFLAPDICLLMTGSGVQYEKQTLLQVLLLPQRYSMRTMMMTG